MKRMHSQLAKFLEYSAWFIGVVSVVTYLGLRNYEAQQASRQVNGFLAQQNVLGNSHSPAQSSGLNWIQTQLTNTVSPLIQLAHVGKQFYDSQTRPGDRLLLPTAVLQSSRLGLSVPVYIGTDEITLNKGAGWIEDSTFLSDQGNIAIAGHRDSFFRSLKDVQAGDILTLKTVMTERHFRVEATRVVYPNNTEVLNSTEQSRLTLVTCYPFYYQGKAPQRFVVSALEIPYKTQ